MNAFALLLQAGGNSTAAFIVQVLPIAAIFLVFYFLVIAPANKQKRKTQEMLNSLKKGDRVVTSGGIYGTVQSVEPEVVYIKIADIFCVQEARSAGTGLIGPVAEQTSC